MFSYFKPMLAMIGQDIAKRRSPYTMITGEVSGLERDRRIQRFNNDPNCKVFLSSDAGAYGINLNQGSHLICYDLSWSAGAMAQRVSRIDRTDSAFGPDPHRLHVRPRHHRGTHVQPAPAEEQGGQGVPRW